MYYVCTLAHAGASVNTRMYAWPGLWQAGGFKLKVQQAADERPQGYRSAPPEEYGVPGPSSELPPLPESPFTKRRPISQALVNGLSRK